MAEHWVAEASGVATLVAHPPQARTSSRTRSMSGSLGRRTGTREGSALNTRTRMRTLGCAPNVMRSRLAARGRRRGTRLLAGSASGVSSRPPATDRRTSACTPGRRRGCAAASGWRGRAGGACPSGRCIRRGCRDRARAAEIPAQDPDAIDVDHVRVRAAAAPTSRRPTLSARMRSARARAPVCSGQIGPGVGGPRGFRERGRRGAHRGARAIAACRHGGRVARLARGWRRDGVVQPPARGRARQADSAAGASGPVEFRPLGQSCHGGGVGLPQGGSSPSVLAAPQIGGPVGGHRVGAVHGV